LCGPDTSHRVPVSRRPWVAHQASTASCADPTSPNGPQWTVIAATPAGSAEATTRPVSGHGRRASTSARRRTGSGWAAATTRPIARSGRCGRRAGAETPRLSRIAVRTSPLPRAWIGHRVVTSVATTAGTATTAGHEQDSNNDGRDHDGRNDDPYCRSPGRHGNHLHTSENRLPRPGEIMSSGNSGPWWLAERSVAQAATTSARSPRRSVTSTVVTTGCGRGPGRVHPH
jgi:hypothetical protein